MPHRKNSAVMSRKAIRYWRGTTSASVWTEADREPGSAPPVIGMWLTCISKQPRLGKL